MRTALALALAVVPAPLLAAEPKPVDVILCLDTSNSMDGLLESAKRKLWVVVNDLAKMEPTPALRVGLYSYGNNTYEAGAGWVRRETALTTDLDEVYKRINALRCAGPGSEEYPTRAVREALGELRCVDKTALKLVFVCGNEPVDQDKEVSTESVADLARTRDVPVNTVYCGTAGHVDAAGWAAFARLCGGKAATIDQDKVKTEVAIKTPFDEEIEALGAKINQTYVWYGLKGGAGRENQLAQDRNATRAAGGVAAERSVTKAGQLYKNAECDLIDRMQTEKGFDLKALKDDELPAELKKLKPEEREPYLKKKAAERTEIQKKVTELGARRALYIEAERKKQAPAAGALALDEALRTILRDAAAKGLKAKD